MLYIPKYNKMLYKTQIVEKRKMRNVKKRIFSRKNPSIPPNILNDLHQKKSKYFLTFLIFSHFSFPQN